MSADNLLSTRGNALADQVTALRRDLALAQDARLAAELRAERWRGWAAEVLGREVISTDLRQRGDLLIDTPPPDFGPLRDLVLAFRDFKREWWESQDQCAEPGCPACKLEEAFRTLLAAYPALDPGAEPAGEGERVSAAAKVSIHAGAPLITVSIDGQGAVLTPAAAEDLAYLVLERGTIRVGSATLELDREGARSVAKDLRAIARAVRDIPVLEVPRG